MRSLFRPTLWPGTTLPAPPRSPMPGALVEGDWIIWPIADGRDLPQVILPEDFCIQEFLHLSPTDIEGAASIVRKYGILFNLDHDEFSDIRDYGEEFQEHFENIPSIFELRDDRYVWGHHREHIKIYIETAQESINTWLISQSETEIEKFLTKEATEENIKGLLQQIPELENREGPEAVKAFKEYRWSGELMELEGTLNAALGGFSVGTKEFTDRYSSVYSNVFLQIYNYMVEEATVRQCANETCGLQFVRQRDRANFGQHKTQGVKYCKRSCARAQAQRELRRRRKSEDKR
jgi:hypothetical protein